MMNVDAARQLSRDIKEIFKRLDDLETNPVSITGGAVPAPVAQGDMLAADAVPAWSILSHPGAAGYALTTDGTDPLWDQTPAWTGLHNFEAGLEIADDQPLNLGDGADAIGTFVSASNYVAWTGVDWRFDVGVGIERDPLSPLHVQSDNNALTDLRDPSNYHVAITNPALDTGEMAALGFYISNEDDDVGGVIGFVRTDLHTKGELRFYTKQSNIDNVAPVLAMTLQDDGDCQFEFDVNLVTGRGIIHADGVAAGQYLRADGTRHIPASIAAGDLPAHANTHENAGADEINVAGLSGELADAQPVAVSKNSGAIVGTRSELNFIEGANVALTIADDAGNDEVDITIATTGLVAAHAILDGSVHTDSAADAVTRGSLIVGNSTPLWDELVIGGAATFLRSDGNDPSWAAIAAGDLPAHTHSGAAQGGSLVIGTTDTDATAGSVFFAGTAGVIQEDNTNFFWDDTNNALGIRSNAPAASAEALYVPWIAGDAATTAYFGSGNVSNNQNAVTGESFSGDGVYGTAAQSAGAGVRGVGTSAASGVIGTSVINVGVYGVSSSSTGIIAESATGEALQVDLTGAGTAIASFRDNGTPVVVVDDGGALQVAQYIEHLGDANTEFEFNTDRVRCRAGGIVMWDAYETTANYLNLHAGLVGINETANANMTIGLTIDQAANDDEIFNARSSDVGAVLSSVETGTYLTIEKTTANAGGALLSGFRDADGSALGALTLASYIAEQGGTGKSSASRGLMEFQSFVTDGSAKVDSTANTNQFVWRTRLSSADATLAVLDADADLQLINGRIATASADLWDLEDYHAGAPTADGYVQVTINGTTYQLLANLP